MAVRMRAGSHRIGAVISAAGFFFLAAIVLLIMHGLNDPLPPGAAPSRSLIDLIRGILPSVLPVVFFFAALLVFYAGYQITGSVLLVCSIVAFILRERRPGL